MDSASHLCVHYYFEDASHSMNALVGHKCDGYIIALVSELSKELGIPIVLEEIASGEGGLKKWLKAAAENPAHTAAYISAFCAVAGLVLSAIPYLDQERGDLEKEYYRSSIELNNLKIEEIRKSLPDDDSRVEFDKLTPRVKEISSGIGRVPFIRSNFYKTILEYPKVVSVGYGSGRSLSVEEVLVHRGYFSGFVRDYSNVPSVFHRDAMIEVVSPVLTSAGKYKWKGVFDGSVISFSMADKSFISEVSAGRVNFKRGTGLICELEIKRRVNEAGDVVPAGYFVRAVEVVDDSLIPASMVKRRVRKVKDVAQVELEFV